MAPYHYNGLSARLEEYMVQTEIWEKICLSQCSTRGAVDPRLLYLHDNVPFSPR